MIAGQVAGLIAVFAVFCIAMGAILYFCLAERRRASASGAPLSGRRIAWLLAAVVALGAGLALTTAYLIFFKTWS